MESSPNKRRKTSPTTSIAVYAQGASHLQKQTQQDTDQRTKARRASFLSPTKASLARFNPGLLPGGISAKFNRNQPSNDTTPRPRLNAVALRTTTPHQRNDEQTTLLGYQGRATRSSPLRATSAIKDRLPAPRRRSQAPNRTISPTKQRSMRNTVDLVAPASPPEDAKEMEDSAPPTVNEQLTKELRATIEVPDVSTVRSSILSLGRTQEIEPELPLTPTQLGLESTPEPPKGLLYSSPSRRARRRKGEVLKSSPLKPGVSAMDDTMTLSSEIVLRRPDVTVQIRDSQIAPNAEEDKTNLVVSEKTHERDRLSIQVTRLQRAVKRLEAEVESTQKSAAILPATQETVDEIMLLLTSEDTTQEPPSKTKHSTVLQRLSLFLPFAKKQSLPTAQSPITQSSPNSHHPLVLLNPTPYLQAFTPLTLSSSETLISSINPDGSLLRNHEITLASPQNVLLTKLLLVDNTSTQAIADLNLMAISPWADRELGSWIRKQGVNADITSIGWAVGRYWEVAFIRATCWRSCEAEHRDLLPIVEIHNDKSAETGKGKMPLPKRRGRRRKADIASENGENSSERELEDAEEKRIHVEFSRQDLLFHIGRQSLLFSQSGASLLITWQIDFDWTGEVESHISACTSVPELWKRADERRSLERVDELFQKLLVERGVYEAIRIVVGLLFPDE